MQYDVNSMLVGTFSEKITSSGDSEKVEVKVKRIDAEIGEVNEENEQDPSLQQLEEEIGQELKNVGFVSTGELAADTLVEIPKAVFA